MPKFANRGTYLEQPDGHELSDCQNFCQELIGIQASLNESDL